MKNLIIIGIATYKRPKMLQKTLKSLSNQIITQQLSVEIVVMDNDRHGSAKKVVYAYQKKMIFPVFYYIEKKRGIPFVRNAVIDIARKRGATELAFIDDDEIAQRDWIENLYAYYLKHKCLVVTGPVVTNFPENTPPWTIEIGLFDRKRDVTGNDRRYAGTGNVLFSMGVFNKMGLRFKEELALSGGSDSYLSIELRGLGVKIKWVDEAIVYETISHSRLNLKWLIKRLYRIRINSVHQSVDFNGKAYTYYFSFLNIGKNILLGLCYLSVSAFFKTSWFYRAIIHFVTAYSTGFGLLFGKKYDEYKTIHGE